MDAKRVVILTINQGEEAVIRVNTSRHVTLEFPNSVITLFEDGGVLYQRHEVQSVDVDAILAGDEEIVDGHAETQPVDLAGETQLDIDVEVEVEQTQLDDYSPSHPSPSYKLTGVPFTPEEVRRFAGGGFTIINRRHLSRIEMEDIAALQQDLFGAGNN
mgnify:FL=1